METNETETQAATRVLNSDDRVEETPSMIEQYLKSKFLEGLDVNAEGGSEIPFFSKFQEIKTLLTEIFRSTQPASRSMKEILYYLNNVLIECQMLSEKHCLFRSPKDHIAINNIRMKLNKIKTELKEIKVHRMASNGNIQQQEPNGSSGDTHIFSPPVTPRSVGASIVHGFDEDVIIVKKLVLSQESEDGFKAIAIVGSYGIGKTTLSQLIFNNQEMKTHFLPRIWVSMSKFPGNDKDPKRAIVKRMLISLGVEEETMDVVFQNHGLQGLLCALHLQLLGKRYLIVLDDARDIDPWYGELNSRLKGGGKWEERFGYGLPKGYGGTVIVSSRDEELAKMMVGEKNLHHLLPLSDPDSCWAIFKDSVEKDGMRFNPSNVQDLRMEVTQKCGGIPLAAKMLGESLHKKIQNESSTFGGNQNRVHNT
ncbi:hypothetical protein FEM48_Zijuj01G0141300 [Ziziphus jujuba var. spinosa]|uniref:NB-ARC domain-containing protein n=1 Tax=Ziziphus jujuba var. spinosa TaxID=714518 RepID=A0A978W1Q4_ZIZJJ|nr:hypothetical protein FEM48_Zijuj01G0141300 [Ziziphus jujuba var. spinosa]